MSAPRMSVLPQHRKRGRKSADEQDEDFIPEDSNVQKKASNTSTSTPTTRTRTKTTLSSSSTTGGTSSTTSTSNFPLPDDSTSNKTVQQQPPSHPSSTDDKQQKIEKVQEIHKYMDETIKSVNGNIHFFPFICMYIYS
jgi:uncharacterized FlaG/YvyC family protein